MSKNRLFSLLFLAVAGLLLAACSVSLPSSSPAAPTSANQIAEIEFTGRVDSIAADQWVIQGYTVAVNAQTLVEAPFNVGDVAHVYAVVEGDGAVVAQRIEKYSASTPTPISTNDAAFLLSGSESELYGVVESIAASQWVVSGQTILITAQTEIKGNIVTGSAVKVHVQMQNGALFAREIELAAGAGAGTQVPRLDSNEIEFYGVVEAITPTSWTVSGQQFGVNAQTEIKNVIAVGDRVKVHLIVNNDNSLTAREIELAFTVVVPPAFGMLEMTGVVQSISGSQWTIGGKTFLVSAQTEIKGAISVGDLVKVEAVINADNSLSATEIKKVVAPDDSSNSDKTPRPTSSNDDDDDDDDDDDNSGSSKGNG